jgi:hypothetical protein
MKNSDLKIRFFKKGAAALRNLIEIDKECYCCPICKRLYLYDDLDSGELTLEHAPPEQVGGKPLALTCKECNSVAGYSIDKAVVQRQRQLDFAKALMGQKSKYSARATFSIGEETLNINFERDQGIVSIKPPKEINDPKKLKAYQDYMMHLYQSGKSDGEKFTITPDAAYHQGFSKVGDLKTAFILCFAFFGYRFSLDKRLSSVREQIINYKQDIIDYYWHTSDPKITREHFIFIIENPIAALAVKLNNSTVILPWLKGPNDLYKYLGDYFTNANREPVTFDGHFFNWPRSLEMRLDFTKAHNNNMQADAAEPRS